MQKILLTAAAAAATTAGREAVKGAPAVTKAAKKFYERVRSRKKKRDQEQIEGDATSTGDELVNLEERIHALEASEEAQAELITQTTEQQESQALAIEHLTDMIITAERRVAFLTLALVVAGLVAVVALIVAIIA